MKDCSLGGEYPVAGLLMIEKNTGKYGLKLGCHPDFGVAMEITLTEATQGGEITIYSNRSYMDFTNKSVYTPHNLMNSFATGKAQYPFQSVSQSANWKHTFIKNRSLWRINNTCTNNCSIGFIYFLYFIVVIN